MPLPDFSAEMSQIANEENAPSAEAVEENAEAVEEPKLTEEEIFKKQKREKLLAHLADCREKSAAKRRALKEEKQKNKKPRGRPRKQEPEVEPSTPAPEPSTQAPPIVVHANPQPVAPTIDYDRIINGVHEKYMSAKEQRKKAKQVPNPTPALQQRPPTPAFDRATFEAQVREDERQRIKAEVEKKKNEQLRQRTKDYYSRLPPRSLSNGKNWDEYFFGQ